MKHDELLESLNFVWSTDEPTLDKAERLRQALRAVVEMCKPSDWDNDDNFYWKKAILETIGRELS